MSGVDVLAVMDAEIASAVALAGSDAYQAERLPKLREARAAVAELIEAITEHGEAVSMYDLAEEFYGENGNHKEMRTARGRAITATKRLRAALARVQGGQS